LLFLLFLRFLTYTYLLKGTAFLFLSGFFYVGWFKVGLSCGRSYAFRSLSLPSGVFSREMVLTFFSPPPSWVRMKSPPSFLLFEVWTQFFFLCPFGYNLLLTFKTTWLAKVFLLFFVSAHVTPVSFFPSYSTRCCFLFFI